MVRARTSGIKIAPDGCGFVGQVMKPNGILRIEHGIGRVDRRLDRVGSQRQFGTLLHQALQQRTTMRILQ